MLNITCPQTAMLAPMAGVADTAYRILARKKHAVMTVSEMISAKGLCYDSKGSAFLCRITEQERPMSLQLFGNEPEFIAKATCLLQDYHPDWIDLNMGCPVPKVTNTGAGSALLKTPELAEACVKSAVKESSVPVTVKMRIGWDEHCINAVEFAKLLESAGAAALTVHGRTRQQLYSGKADWNMIKQVKQAVNIPVIGNGDIRNAKDCERMYQETDVDLVAVGRASYGNPWIFEEINCYRKNLAYTAPTLEERMHMMLEHIQLILKYSEKPPEIAIREARKHASWYMTGLKFASAFRARCYQLSSYQEAEQLVEEFLKCNL
ncbi:MAG: tRNA dihydrouridine synthase DusB [Oscillospiraceae bacterium]|nr:tRNA dihydrouridine synthase DusB [Oscillospiraceae bacterium]